MPRPHVRPRVLVAAVAVAAVATVGGVALVTLRDRSEAAPAPHVLTSDGRVDASAYRRIARSLGTPLGIAYRFGEPASTPAGATTTVAGVSEKPFDGHGTSVDRTYQLGGPQDASLDDYSSDQGQLGYVADAGSPSVGVDQIETLGMWENTFSSKPRLSWTYYGEGHPDPDVLPDSAGGRCMARLGVSPGRFVAQARAYAHLEDTANTLIAFDNGVIVAAGTNTARGGGACVQLPAGLHPSAISVTGGNEFALVTAWNDRTMGSELVVVALAGQQKDFWDYDWKALYPGLRNYGRPTFAKVLGSIPLPMAAPTSVSAVADVSGSQLAFPNGGRALLGQLTLSDEANRRSFIDGLNRDNLASAGYAIVASREERKVAFVDLQPLFQKITRAYFGSRAEFDRITADVGQDDRQWPYAFSTAPDERPVVVKTVTTDAPPSAVAGMLSGAETPRAYVATADGRLHVWSVTGLATAAPASAEAIREVGSIEVGANPTGITYVKDRGSDRAVAQSVEDTLIVTARGDRAVQWVRLSGDGGTVVRTLRDSRIVDPVSAEDDNVHGTESYVVSIADYGGRQLLNYRYGPVIFHTNGGAEYGMGPDGRAPFEFSGAYRPGGRPFSISVTNVT